jgi:hypothetical protein
LCQQPSPSIPTLAKPDPTLFHKQLKVLLRPKNNSFATGFHPFLIFYSMPKISIYVRKISTCMPNFNFLLRAHHFVLHTISSSMFTFIM